MANEGSNGRFTGTWAARLRHAIGEFFSPGPSSLAARRRVVFGGRASAPYILQPADVNLDLVRGLYHNDLGDFQLGAWAAKPVVNTITGFMGTPEFHAGDKTVQDALDTHLNNRTSIFRQLHRDTLRDGTRYVRLYWAPDSDNPLEGKDPQIGIRVYPPEYVTVELDPESGLVSRALVRFQVQWTRDNGDPAVYQVEEALDPATITITYTGEVPPDKKAGQRPNQWGFVPIVVFRNEAEVYEATGRSELSAIIPFMRAYHDVMVQAIQGHKLHATPKLKIRLADIRQFMLNNFGVDPEQIRPGQEQEISLEGRDLLLLVGEEEADFLQIQPATGDSAVLLKFLFRCIVDVSQTPEFAFGTAISGSRASVQEQYPVLIRKVTDKREQLSQSYDLLARMALAILERAQGVKFPTWSTSLVWDAIDPRSDDEITGTLEKLVNAFAKGTDAGLISLEAAVDHLAEYVPTMARFMGQDPETPNERDRIIRSLILRRRIDDPLGHDLAEREALEAIRHATAQRDDGEG